MNGDRDRRDVEIERLEAEVERLRERVAHSMAVVHQRLELYGAFNDRASEPAAAKPEQAGEEAKSALSITRDLSMMLRRSEIGGGLGEALGPARDHRPAGRALRGRRGGRRGGGPAPRRGQPAFPDPARGRSQRRHALGPQTGDGGAGVFSEGMAVEHDGLGFGVGNGEVGGVGMRAMKEHAVLLGVALRVSSGPDAGTKVEVSVPLAEEDVR